MVFIIYEARSAYWRMSIRKWFFLLKASLSISSISIIMWRSCGSLGLTQWHLPSGTLGRIQRRNVVWWYKGEHIDSCEDWTCYNSEYNCSSWITSITDSRCQLQAMQHNACRTDIWLVHVRQYPGWKIIIIVSLGLIIHSGLRPAPPAREQRVCGRNIKWADFYLAFVYK